VDRRVSKSELPADPAARHRAAGNEANSRARRETDPGYVEA